MHREDIKAELRKRGASAADIARGLGVTRSAVTNTLAGTRRSRRIEAEIARVLDVPLHRLWPERYPAPDGGPA